MSSDVWHVYVPHLLLHEEPSFLCGSVSQDTRTVYLTASTLLHSDINHLPTGVQFIGYWSNTESVPRRRKTSRPCDVVVDMCLDSSGDVRCALYYQDKHCQCTVIVYNPCDLLNSEILLPELSRSESYHGIGDFPSKCDSGLSADTGINEGPAKTRDHTDAVLSLSNVLHTTRNSFHDIQKTNTKLYIVSPKHSYIGQKAISMVVFFVTLLHFPFKWVKTGCWRSGQSNNTILNAIGAPTTFAQCTGRQNLIRQISSNDAFKPGEKLRTMSVCTTQCVDTLFGLILMYAMMTDNRAQHVADLCLTYGDRIALELNVLLDWLMGAPAGLKLNSQLTHILGKFFLYHIYLWSGYLVVLKPVLGQLVYVCSIAGIWGLSAQLALFQDILSTMTIHIYCFYVYAARLYRLQMYTLGSLWRLFRGKKWNVLRERVDSAIYDVDQLFVGTLLFTVLLFILPTTGLYYVVFTLLRVFVLSMQGIVSRVRHHLNTIPWWFMILWVQNSQALTNGAVFHLKSYTSYNNDSTLVLGMKTTKPSLIEILTDSKASHTSSYSWGTIVKHLFLGHLIYPWIERKSQT